MSNFPVRTPTVTIAAGESLSGATYIGHQMWVALQMPAAWDTAVITFQASSDGVTYGDVFDFEGNEVTLTTAASRYVTIDEAKIGPWIKLRSGTTGSAVNQTLASVITLVMQALPIP